MNTHTSTLPASTPQTQSTRDRLAGDPAYQAFWLMRVAFTVAPILFGADKFFHLMTNWDKYLAPWVDRIVPGTAHQAMYVVGAIEIVAGLLVLWRPKIGSLVVAAWLLGIIVNLVSIGGYLDIALRDVGLFLAALTLGRLATAVQSRP